MAWVWFSLIAAAVHAVPLPADVAKTVAAAATTQRVEIRQHYGLSSTADDWLDGVVGFHAGARTRLKQKLREAVARAATGGEPFKVGVMGPSTTAGHDNYHNQSYSHVFGRHFGAALSVVGGSVTVRNHAVGGVGPMPGSLCAEAMIGGDLDLAVWDYMVVSRPNDCRVEHFTRALASTPGRPVILFFQGHMYVDSKLSAASLEPPTANLKQTCRGRWIVAEYADSIAGTHWFSPRALLAALRFRARLPLLADGSVSLYADPNKVRLRQLR